MRLIIKKNMAIWLMLALLQTSPVICTNIASESNIGSISNIGLFEHEISVCDGFCREFLESECVQTTQCSKLPIEFWFILYNSMTFTEILYYVEIRRNIVYYFNEIEIFPSSYDITLT